MASTDKVGAKIIAPKIINPSICMKYIPKNISINPQKAQATNIFLFFTSLSKPSSDFLPIQLSPTKINDIANIDELKNNFEQ